MDTNRLDLLIERAKESCECNVYIHNKDVMVFETKIGIKLSADFLYIANKYHFEYLGTFEWSGFRSGMIDNTEYYRTLGLHHRYIVLADQGDAGVVLMETQDDPEKPSPVIWCDYPDIFNLCEEGKFKYNPDIWPSFADFFEYLVAEEEKRLNE